MLLDYNCIFFFYENSVLLLEMGLKSKSEKFQKWLHLHTEQFSFKCTPFDRFSLSMHAWFHWYAHIFAAQRNSFLKQRKLMANGLIDKRERERREWWAVLKI